mgnify:FL=1|tara:strand:+ start:1072 stop:1353 length:282 start_codon:yes stop_codon:yes gene_type:complete
MAFNDIFKDENEYNEKAIIGFMSFGVMTLTALIDIVTGAFGKELLIQEFIYNSFVWITLGSFGIAGAEKVMGNGNQNNGSVVVDEPTDDDPYA